MIREYDVLAAMEGDEGREIESGVVAFVLDGRTAVHAQIKNGEIELYVSARGWRGQIAVRSISNNMVRVGVVEHNAPLYAPTPAD